MTEVQKIATVWQTETNHSAIQAALSEQAKHLFSENSTWIGNPYPGDTLVLDNLTLTGIKFIVSADYSDIDASSDCGRDASTIQLKYIKYL